MTFYDPASACHTIAVAPLRENAVVEDIDMKAVRGLLFKRLAAGEWIKRHQNLRIVVPTGVGKSPGACALGRKALCRAVPDKKTRTFTRSNNDSKNAG